MNGSYDDVLVKKLVACRWVVAEYLFIIAVGTTAIAERPLDAGPQDARIELALKQVSPARIQATIEKLVSFQTRSALSAQDPASIAAGHGIGAAREWIKSQLESYSNSAEWEHVQGAGNVTRVTLPMSKDNLTFVVAVVDKEEHQSLPVVPMPER